MPEMRTGGQILAQSMIENGSDLLTLVPGECFLAFLDALAGEGSPVKVLAFRHEGGAAFAAEAYGKLTGKVGVCAVGRGPGAAQAAIGVHTAFQDSTPMILVIGQVPSHHLGREAFQEVDLAAMFRPLAKLVLEARDTARLPELMARAYGAAQSGRPGPVVVIVPEDVLSGTARCDDVAPVSPTLPHPGPCKMDGLARMLAGAKRPLALVGGGGWTPEAVAGFTRFAESWRLPVAACFRNQDRVDNDSDCYVGELGYSAAASLTEALGNADLVLAVGSRLGEVDTASYSLLRAPVPDQRLIHVFPEPEELGRVYRPALAIAAAMPAFARALDGLGAPDPIPWEEWRAMLRARHLANGVPGPCPGPLDMGQVMAEIQARLAPDAIICTGAGNYTGWPQRFLRYHRYPSQIAPANGSMGYGLPAALAAKALYPHRQVLAFAGDGCFLMTAQELATARLHKLAPLIIVVDNGMYGTIRMHQEINHPGRAFATDLANPDFAALARSYGAWAETVDTTRDFAPAFERALAAGTLALLHLRLDPEAITTHATLSDIRAKALTER